MMEKYRLKPEAIPYFSDNLAKKIESFSFWKNHNVDLNALEEIKEFYIESGHYSIRNKDAKHIQGWTSGNFDTDGIPYAEFHFTARINGIENIDYNLINGKDIRILMNDFEEVLGYWYHNLLKVKP